MLSGNAYGGIFGSTNTRKNRNQILNGYRYEDVSSLAVNSTHHNLLESGWVSVYLNNEQDFDDAVDLLKNLMG